MLRVLRRAARAHPLVLPGGVALFGGAAVALATSTGDALLLVRVGPGPLAALFALSSLLLVFSLGWLGDLADRVQRGRLLAGLAGGAALLLLLCAALDPVAPRIMAAVLVVLPKQLGAALDLGLWVALADRFDARALRRYFPICAALQGGGVALGSLALGRTIAYGPGAALGLAAICFAVAAGLALGLTPRALVGGRARAGGLRSGLRAVRQSQLASRLAWLVAIGAVVAPILYVALGAEAARHYGGEREVAGFLGHFRGAVQLVALLVQAGLAPILAARAGVAPTLLVAPTAAIAAAVALVVRSDLAVVGAAQAVMKVLDSAVEAPAERLAQNLLAPERRGRVAGFLDGTAKRLGAMAGAALAALYAGQPRLCAALAVAAAVTWLVTALRLRRRFAELALAELAGRPTERPPADEAAALLDERSLERLRGELRQADPVRRELAGNLVAELGGRGRVDAIAELAAASSATGGADLWAALARLLEAGALPGPGAAAPLARLAADRGLGERDRALAIRALGLCGAAAGELALEVGTPALYLALELARARAGGDRAELIRLCRDGLVGAPSERVVVQAELRGEVARAVAAARWDEPALTALRLLAGALVGDEAGANAGAVGRGLAAVPDAAIRGLLGEPARERALALCAEASAPRRLAGFELLAALGDPRDASHLTRALGDGDAAIRGAAGRGLAQLGDGALEELLVAASFGRRAARHAALELLGELRPSPLALDHAIERELGEIDQLSLRRAALAPLERAEWVHRRLDERQAEMRHTLLLLVATRHGLPAVRLAAERLRRGRDPRARARVVEALDAALPRAVAPRILVACDEGDPARLAAAAAERVGGPLAFDAAVAAELDGGDRLGAALLIAALPAAARQTHRQAIYAAAEHAMDAVDPVSLLRRLTRGEPDARVEVDVPGAIETMLALGKLPWFGELSARELGELADAGQVVALVAGEELAAEPALSLVLAGELRAGALAIGPGAAVGELCLVDALAEPPVAIAGQPTRLFVLSRARFEEVAGEVPGIALAVCHALAARLRAG